jgi:signal transduction histidine kinase
MDEQPVNLSFAELLTASATLPPDSAIYWIQTAVDSMGVTQESGTALTGVYAAANSPIFSYSDAFFGSELVGGPMQSVAQVSRLAASVAVRILGGERAGDIKTPTTGFATPKYDWRQLQRWSISERLLPPGSEVYFREPSAWERYHREILIASLAMLLQAALIIWLIYEHRRRHSAEITAREAMSELTQMDRIAGAGQLSASIAHEVNQPLTAIAMNAAAALNWLKSRTPDMEEVRAALGRISTDSQRAGEIIGNLRAMFTRGTRHNGPVDLNKVILSVLELVRVELQKDQISVRTELVYGSPIVLGNQVQLQQLVLNLVMNARDAMRSVFSQRELFIKCVASGPDRVQVLIEDTGPRLSSSDVEKVFQPMFTTKSTGMGMGLAICRSIVEAHEGRIWVTPGSKTGAAFWFSLPVDRSSATLAA